ncbi:PTS sugar transporter subunit IIA [Lactobacillus sp. ESL0791]|uniref:PTS sugar transporter subunit IIA n=1 Tax=Lactobacillus sp. ESL0791 TaxID=2983234 RepID=UPI0023F937EA|nr:PTS sugar transporter subunit IIA [Lactobacillus sp. ESL0791]MDF7638596.1 PTS sugar transporter subunit IIA [Lactobacillus sp. ESL0791]
MSEYSDLFDKKLIFWNISASDRDDLYRKVSTRLQNLGVVKESYYSTLCKREDEFPTGVKTQYLPIALPHANPENVNQAFIAVVQTNKDIAMKQMGTNEDEVTKNFFFLGIVKEKQSLQVKLLQRFMQLMNDEEFVDKFKNLTNSDDVYEYLVEHF